MAFAIPAMVLNLLLAWLWLQRLQRWYPGGGRGSTRDQEQRALREISRRYTELGRMSTHEIQVAKYGS